MTWLPPAQTCMQKSLSHGYDEPPIRCTPILTPPFHVVPCLETSCNIQLCVMQMRSSRNFCLDVVLICIILGLAVYLVELFKK